MQKILKEHASVDDMFFLMALAFNSSVLLWASKWKGSVTPMFSGKFSLILAIYNLRSCAMKERWYPSSVCCCLLSILPFFTIGLHCHNSICRELRITEVLLTFLTAPLLTDWVRLLFLFDEQSNSTTLRFRSAKFVEAVGSCCETRISTQLAALL